MGLMLARACCKAAIPAGLNDCVLHCLRGLRFLRDCTRNSCVMTNPQLQTLKPPKPESNPKPNPKALMLTDLGFRNFGSAPGGSMAPTLCKVGASLQTEPWHHEVLL